MLCETLQNKTVHSYFHYNAKLKYKRTREGLPMWVKWGSHVQHVRYDTVGSQYQTKERPKMCIWGRALLARNPISPVGSSKGSNFKTETATEGRKTPVRYPQIKQNPLRSAGKVEDKSRSQSRYTALLFRATRSVDELVEKVKIKAELKRYMYSAWNK